MVESYQYIQKITQSLQTIESFSEFMKKYKEMNISMTNFMNEYQTIFKMNDSYHENKN